MPSWLTDIGEATRHPVRATIFAAGGAAVCWWLLAYFAVGPHSLGGATAFAALIGVACALGMTRALLGYEADPTRAGRAKRTRWSAVRLMTMWGVLLVAVLLALLLHSYAVLVLGLIVSVIAPLLLRLLGRD